MPPGPLDPRLATAVDLFNSGEFFACHDVLEEIWSESLDDERTFFQGLIHAAVALHHFEGGNLGGARKMSFSAMRYLAPYAANHAGLALGRFLAAFKVCVTDLQGATEETLAAVALDPNRLPRLEWCGR